MKGRFTVFSLSIYESRKMMSSATQLLVFQPIFDYRIWRWKMRYLFIIHSVDDLTAVSVLALAGVSRRHSYVPLYVHLTIEQARKQIFSVLLCASFHNRIFFLVSFRSWKDFTNIVQRNGRRDVEQSEPVVRMDTK